MSDLKLNETPVRTARNFNCNNIVLKDLDIPENYEKFNSVKMDLDTSKINVEEKIENKKLTYGLGELLENQIKENSNKTIKLVVNGKSKKESVISFDFNKENINLVENIEIVAEENSSANIFIKYSSSEDGNCENAGCENMICTKSNTQQNLQSYYHNGIIRLIAKANSKLEILTSVKRFIDTNNNKNLKLMLDKDIWATNVYTIGYEYDSWNNLDFTQKLITKTKEA